jgi:hypothetical protein
VSDHMLKQAEQQLMDQLEKWADYQETGQNAVRTLNRDDSKDVEYAEDALRDAAIAATDLIAAWRDYVQLKANHEINESVRRICAFA